MNNEQLSAVLPLASSSSTSPPANPPSPPPDNLAYGDAGKADSPTVSSKQGVTSSSPSAIYDQNLSKRPVSASLGELSEKRWVIGNSQTPDQMGCPIFGKEIVKGQDMDWHDDDAITNGDSSGQQLQLGL